MKCKECAHGKVCSYVAECASLAKKSSEILPGEEIAAMGDSYPFSVEIKCKHFAPILINARPFGSGSCVSGLQDMILQSQ